MLLQHRNARVGDQSRVMKQCQFTRLEFIWLELTRKCNLRCTHCYADSEPALSLEGSMTVDSWKAVMANARQLGCEGVQFIGGEVLLVPYLESLIHEARTLGYSFVEVFTNATAVTAKTIECFKRHSVRVATSFYSCNAAVHDHITQKPGSWKRTLSALTELQKADLPIRVGVIALPANEQDVDDTMSFIQGIGIADVGIDRVRSLGRAKSFARGGSYLDELCGQCGRNRLCVTADGDVLPCIMARDTPLGNYFSSGNLEQSTSWSELQLFRAELVGEKEASDDGVGMNQGNCTPDCWPHGGCAPHDLCKPHKSTVRTVFEEVGLAG